MMIRTNHAEAAESTRINTILFFSRTSLDTLLRSTAQAGNIKPEKKHENKCRNTSESKGL